MRDTQREAETQAEGETGSMRGAPRRTRSRNWGSPPEPKSCSTTEPLRHPRNPFRSKHTILNHHVHFKYLIMLFVHYTSVRLEKEKTKTQVSRLETQEDPVLNLSLKARGD